MRLLLHSLALGADGAVTNLHIIGPNGNGAPPHRNKLALASRIHVHDRWRPRQRPITTRLQVRRIVRELEQTSHGIGSGSDAVSAAHGDYH